MEEELQHHLVTYSDGQQIVIPELPLLKMRVEIDDVDVVSTVPISQQQATQIMQTDAVNFDTINSEITPNQDKQPNMPDPNLSTQTPNSDGII